MAPMPLHEAIRTAYAGRARQEDIADKIGINQSQISRWSRGENLPTLEQLAQIEDAAGRPRGFILNAAGLTSPVTTVREAVAMDPNLSWPFPPHAIRRTVGAWTSCSTSTATLTRACWPERWTLAAASHRLPRASPTGVATSRRWPTPPAATRPT